MVEWKYSPTVNVTSEDVVFTNSQFGLFGGLPFLDFFVWSLRNAVFVFNISSHTFLSETPKLETDFYLSRFSAAYRGI